MYSNPFNPHYKMAKASIYLAGNHGRIYGAWDGCFNSNDVLMNELEAKNPNSVILGEVAYTDMETIKKGLLKY